MRSGIIIVADQPFVILTALSLGRICSRVPLRWSVTLES